MKASELKLKVTDELLEELVDLRREQFNLRMQQATGQMARPDQYRKVRKNIAALRQYCVHKESRRQSEGASS